MEARPRSRRKLRLARFLWYADRVRSPLEWLLLASVFFAVIGFRNAPGFEKMIWPLPRWILLAWFVVALLNAIASRGGKGLLGDETPGLRLRSLHLVAAWILLLGFGLAVGLLAGRDWRHLRSPWLWLGGALAGLLFAPYVAWNAANGPWPRLSCSSRVRVSPSESS